MRDFKMKLTDASGVDMSDTEWLIQLIDLLIKRTHTTMYKLRN